MKRQFKTRTCVAVAAVTILIVQAWAQSTKPTRPPVPSPAKATHVLIIGDVVASKHDQAAFEAVLDSLSSDAVVDLYSYDEQNQCKHHTAPHSHKVCIRTDRVITPDSASNQASNITFIQTRTTVQVASKSWSDITKVTSELQ